MNKKKTTNIQLSLSSDELEILSKLDRDNICSGYDWCGEYSDDCEKCPVYKLFDKIEGVKKC